MRIIQATVDRLSLWLAYVGGVAVLLMMLHVSADVLCKYLFNLPIVATLEIASNYYMVAVVFLPLAVIEREGSHIYVEVFTAGLRTRAQAVLDVGAMLLATFYVAALFVTSVEVAIQKTSINEIWFAMYFDLSIWPARWLIPAGCLLLMMQFALKGIRAFRLARTKPSETNPLPPVR